MKKILILLLLLSLSGCKPEEEQKYVNVECKLIMVFEMRQTLEGFDRFDSMDSLILVTDSLLNPHILSINDASELIVGQKYAVELKQFFNLDSKLIDFNDTFELLRKAMYDGTVEKIEIVENSSGSEETVFSCDIYD